MDIVWANFYSFTTKNVMKNIKYQTVGTVPKSNNKHIVETLTEATWIPLTQYTCT